MALRVLFFSVVHLLALASFFLPIDGARVGAALTFYLWMGIGITVGYHRLLTHQAFKCPRWLEYLIITGGAASVQGSPLWWVANHRFHHGRSDSESDLHSPRYGFWWSHMGWVLKVKPGDHEAWRKYARELGGRRYYHLLSRAVLAPFLGVVVGVGLTLGWEAVPFVVCLPMVVCSHVTYAINSVCHYPRFGSRRFPTRDQSRNVWWLSVLSLGESWHNNHHALPRSARQGMAWYEVDISWGVICVLERLGLVWDVQVPYARPAWKKAFEEQGGDALPEESGALEVVGA